MDSIFSTSSILKDISVEYTDRICYDTIELNELILFNSIKVCSIIHSTEMLCLYVLNIFKLTALIPFTLYPVDK